MEPRDTQSPRIAPLVEPYEESVRVLLESMMPPGIPPLRLFRTIAHSPRILEKLRAGNLLDRGPLARRDREIIILRTTARCRSEYEWGVHVAAFAAHYAIDETTVSATATADWSDPVWSNTEAPLVRLADELHETSEVSDELWALLTRAWSSEQIIEMLTLVGFYHTISFFTNALRIGHETGAPRFPQVR